VPCPGRPAGQQDREKKNNFCPAGQDRAEQDRAGQGGRATGQPCPDDGLCLQHICMLFSILEIVQIIYKTEKIFKKMTCLINLNIFHKVYDENGF
jgi:hypothetical protein